jgi:pyrimidine operon attenuation protein/uracil phosphoribosyltransferase
MAPSLRSAGAAAAATAPASAPLQSRAATVLLSPAEVQRAVARLAREIARVHRNAGELVLMGIQTGGVHLARQLAAQLAREWKGRVTVGQLDIAMHRDDLDQHLAPPVHPTTVPVDLADKVVVLVDDVLSTGRTVRAALDALHDLGRPRTVHLAVLVERPHRALPIRPDFVGKRVRTAPEDRVEVQLNGEDGLGAVLLIRGGNT